MNSSKVTRWYYVILVVFCFLAYGNSLKNQFTYDDTATVTENYLIRSFKNIPRIFTRDYFSLAGEISYRPLVTFNYFLDYKFYRLKPSGYHLTNLLLHLFSILLLFKVFSLFIGGEKAFWLAILYLVFPVNTEPVNSISFREDILVLLFGLLSFLSYLYFLDQKQKKFFLVLSLLSYFLAALGKENAVILPFLFLGYEISFKKEKPDITSYFCYGAVLAIFLALQFTILANPFLQQQVPYLGGSISAALINIPVVVLYYFRKLIFPYPLLAEYPPIHLAVFPQPLFWISLLTALIIIGLFILSYRLDKIIFFGLGWFFICFIPISNLIPLANPIAERFMYLPAIGFILILVQLLWKIKPKQLKTSILIILTGIYIFITIPRNNDWRDDLTLWSKTVRQLPVATARVNYNLGLALYRKGDIGKAVDHYYAALKMDPKDTDTRNNLGLALLQQGKTTEAITHLSAALKINPKLAKTQNNLGLALAQQGKLDEAMTHFATALRINPYLVEAYNNLGNVMFLQGKLTEAINYYSTALKIDPNYDKAHYNLQKALVQQQKQIKKGK